MASAPISAGATPCSQMLARVLGQRLACRARFGLRALPHGLRGLGRRSELRCRSERLPGAVGLVALERGLHQRLKRLAALDHALNDRDPDWHQPAGRSDAASRTICSRTRSMPRPPCQHPPSDTHAAAVRDRPVRGQHQERSPELRRLGCSPSSWPVRRSRTTSTLSI